MCAYFFHRRKKILKVRDQIKKSTFLSYLRSLYVVAFPNTRENPNIAQWHFLQKVGQFLNFFQAQQKRNVNITRWGGGGKLFLVPYPKYFWGLINFFSFRVADMEESMGWKRGSLSELLLQLRQERNGW